MHPVVVAYNICIVRLTWLSNYIRCTNVFGSRDTAGQERFRSMTRCQYRGTKVRIHTTVQLDDEFLFTKYCFGASRSNLHDATIAAVFTGSGKRFLLFEAPTFSALCVNSLTYLLTYM